MGSVRVPRGWAARLAVAGLVAATAVAGVAAPAAAEDDPGWVSAWLDDITVGTPGAPGRTAELRLSSTGATDPRVSFDLTGLAGVAAATFPSWCVTSASTVTCPMPPTATPDEWGTVEGTVPVVLRALAGATAGTTGTLGYTVAADRVEPQAQQAAVTVAAGPVPISLVDAYVPGPAVGDTVNVPVSVVNGGGEAAEDLRLTLRFSVGLVPAAYRNCRYGTDPMLLTTVMVCTVRGSFVRASATSCGAALRPRSPRPRWATSGHCSSSSRWPPPGRCPPGSRSPAGSRTASCGCGRSATR